MFKPFRNDRPGDRRLGRDRFGDRHGLAAARLACQQWRQAEASRRRRRSCRPAMDLSDGAAVDAGAEDGRGAGTIDILVNNAGVTRDNLPCG